MSLLLYQYSAADDFGTHVVDAYDDDDDLSLSENE